MTKKVRKNKKNKNKFKVQKPLEGRTLPNIFNPDGTLNEFYKKSGGGVSEGIKNIQAKGMKDGDMILSPKADLDGDGMFSEYEKKRGMAVQKAMAENDKPVKVAQASQGRGIAIRGTKFKGVF